VYYQAGKINTEKEAKMNGYIILALGFSAQIIVALLQYIIMN